MKYQGSKAKLVKHLLPLMLAERKPGQAWIEPFVGGANMIDKVDGLRIGNDANFYLIELLKAVQSGWVPPANVSLEMYKHVEADPCAYEPPLVGFVGFLCSWGGRWFNSYAQDKAGTNYAERGSRLLNKQAQKFKDVQFTCMDYLRMDIPEKSLVYCDPPYQFAGGYKFKIDHFIFWEWCKWLGRKGHTVFISEYSAPDDFECVMTIEHCCRFRGGKPVPRIEKLFRYKK